MLSPNLTNLNFETGVNYLKQDSSSGSANITLSTAILTTTVTHNLGYIPFFQVFGDLDQSGTIYTPDVLNYTSWSSAFYAPDHPFINAWATTTTLTIQLDNSSAANTGVVPIYWLIYKDYGTVS